METTKQVQEDWKSAPVVAAETPDELAPIRARAYAIYLERQKSGVPGCAEDDWCAAEKELGGTKKPRA